MDIDKREMKEEVGCSDDEYERYDEMNDYLHGVPDKNGLRDNEKHTDNKPYDPNDFSLMIITLKGKKHGH